MTPDHPRPTVDLIIIRDSDIVLIRRKYPPPGWALPGGFVEIGESLEEAAVREGRRRPASPSLSSASFTVIPIPPATRGATRSQRSSSPRGKAYWPPRMTPPKRLSFTVRIFPRLSPSITGAFLRITSTAATDHRSRPASAVFSFLPAGQ